MIHHSCIIPRISQKKIPPFLLVRDNPQDTPTPYSPRSRVDLCVSHKRLIGSRSFCLVQVSVGWGESLAGGPLAQADALQRVAAALDLLPDLDLSGVPIMIGDRSGLDHLGQMWLPADGMAREWAR